MDTLLGKVVEAVTESGRGGRTIVVVVGDHGEAFGEHPGSFTHGVYLYNEGVHVPMLFYQPRLFAPGVVSEPTSHVDIVPTLLDALGVPYDPLALQGESVLRVLRRRYVFMVSPTAATTASVSRHGIKLFIDDRHGRCTTYDLASDPEERRPMGCTGHEEQMTALLMFRRHQDSILFRYNEACRKPGRCPGALAMRGAGPLPGGGHP